MLTRTLPSGITSTWSYDAAGRRTGLDVAGREMAFERDAVGRTVAQAFAGGVVASAFDAAGRVTHRSFGNDGHKASWSVDYGYAPSGELLTAHDSASGRREYALDVLGRIERVGAGASERYGYDAAGNVTAAAWGGPHDGSRAAQGERVLDGALVRVAGRDHLEHDAAGRLVRRRRRLLSGGSKEWTFSWGAGDRLREVTTPDDATWRYGYDVLGRRVSKSQVLDDGSVGESVLFAWDGPVLVEQVRSGPGAPAEVSVWEHEDWSPVAQLRGTVPPGEGLVLAEGSSAWVDAQFAAIVTDLVGSPVRAVSDGGDLVWSGSASVWGLQPAGASVMPLRLPGQYADDETGLHYNLFRYYDPTTARYVSPDPLGLEPSPNAYTYPANPTTELDPMGLAPCQPTSRAARRQAMRENGIPTSQQPVAQRSSPAGHSYEYEVQTPAGCERRVVSDQTTDRVAGHGPHWEAGRAKVPYRRDPFGRLRVYNDKSKVEYGH